MRPAGPPPAAGGEGLALQGETLRAFVLGFVGVAIFAATLPATKIALLELEPDFIAFGRAVFAGVLAALALGLVRQPPPTLRQVPLLLVIAACVVFGFPYFTGLAMVHVPASHGGVVLAVLPLATAVAAALVGGERPGLLFWLVSVGGGAIVLVYSLSGAGWSLLWGDLYLLAAAASAALGYALSGRLARTMPGWAVISWALVLALPATLVASLASAPAAVPSSPAVLLAFAYLGAGSMFLGFFFWNRAMARGGIAKIGQIQLLQPFLTIAIAALVASERVALRDVGFALVIVAAVAVAQRLKVARTTR